MALLSAYQNSSLRNFTNRAQTNNSDFTGLLGTSSRTLECWVNVPNFTNNTDGIEIFFGWGERIDGQNFHVGTRGNRFTFLGEFYDLLTDFIFTTNDFNKWIHFALTYENTGADIFKFYINGIESTFTKINYGPAKAGVVINTTEANNRLVIGGYDSVTYPFEGKIDEIRIWDTVRTETQIRDNLMKELNPSLESNLRAYYRMTTVTYSGEPGLTFIPNLVTYNTSNTVRGVGDAQIIGTVTTEPGKLLASRPLFETGLGHILENSIVSTLDMVTSLQTEVSPTLEFEYVSSDFTPVSSNNTGLNVPSGLTNGEYYNITFKYRINNYFPSPPTSYIASYAVGGVIPTIANRDFITDNINASFLVFDSNTFFDTTLTNDVILRNLIPLPNNFTDPSLSVLPNTFPSVSGNLFPSNALELEYNSVTRELTLKTHVLPQGINTLNIPWQVNDNLIPSTSKTDNLNITFTYYDLILKYLKSTIIYEIDSSLNRNTYVCALLEAANGSGNIEPQIGEIFFDSSGNKINNPSTISLSYLDTFYKVIPDNLGVNIVNGTISNTQKLDINIISDGYSILIELPIFNVDVLSNTFTRRWDSYGMDGIIVDFTNPTEYNDINKMLEVNLGYDGDKFVVIQKYPTLRTDGLLFPTTNVTPSMTWLFRVFNKSGNASLFHHDFDCSRIVTTNMTEFYRLSNRLSLTTNTSLIINMVGVEEWDTSNSTNVSGCFINSSNFNRDVSYWDVSKCLYVGSMFQDCVSFNFGSAPYATDKVINWTFLNNGNGTIGTGGSVVSFGRMFYGCDVFNQDIRGWIVENGDFGEFLRSPRSSGFNQSLLSWNANSNNLLKTNIPTIPNLFSPTNFVNNANLTYRSPWFTPLTPPNLVNISRKVIRYHFDNVTEVGVSFQVNESCIIDNFDTDSTINLGSLIYILKTDGTIVKKTDQYVAVDPPDVIIKVITNSSNIGSYSFPVKYLVPSDPGPINTSSPESFNFNIVASTIDTNTITRIAPSGNSGNFTKDPSDNKISLIIPQSLFNSTNIIKIPTQFFDLIDFGKIITTELTDISNFQSIFGSASFFTNLNQWDVSNVVNFSNVFQNITGVFGSDISVWNTSSGETFTNMFKGCTNFNNDLSGWNMSSATNVDGMFANCNIFAKDLRSWKDPPSNITSRITFEPTDFSPNQDANGSGSIGTGPVGYFSPWYVIELLLNSPLPYILTTPINNGENTSIFIKEDTLSYIDFGANNRNTEINLNNQIITQPSDRLVNFEIDPATGYLKLIFPTSLKPGNYILDLNVESINSNSLPYQIQFTVSGIFDVRKQTTKNLEKIVQTGNITVTSENTTGSVLFPKNFTINPMIFLNKLNLTSLQITSYSNTGFSYSAAGTGTFTWIAIQK